MSLERFVDALRQLEQQTATSEDRAAVLASITRLERLGRIDTATADSWRSIIKWLAGGDLEERAVRFVFDELAQDLRMLRAISTLGLS